MTVSLSSELVKAIAGELGAIILSAELIQSIAGELEAAVTYAREEEYRIATAPASDGYDDSSIAVAQASVLSAQVTFDAFKAAAGITDL